MAGSPVVGSRAAVQKVIVASRGKIVRSAATSADKGRCEVTVAGQTKGDAAGRVCALDGRFAMD